MLARKIILLLLISVCFAYAFNSDDTDIKTITSSLEKFRKNYPQEKVHLHLDKPYYAIGDTMYFTGYVVNAEKNTPSVISNILYVDLINDSSNVLETLRFPINDGIVDGSMVINDSLSEGNYRVRAYTNWMRNFDHDFFFDAVIAVGNGIKNDVVAFPTYQFKDLNKAANAVSIQYTSLHNNSLQNKDVNYTIINNKKEKINGKAITNDDGKIQVDLSNSKLANNQTVVLITHIKIDNKTTVTKELQLNIPATKNTIHFFPEGGDMIAGITTKIGFKAMDANGFGADVSGVIKDDSTNETINFKSGFAGIGSFQFTPQFNHTYHASVQYKNGNKDDVELPVIKATGYVLNIDNSNADSLSINISSKQNITADKIIIAAQTNNRIQFAKSILLTDGSTHFSISKKKLPTGIIQFTLFDTALHPVAERLAFINHNDELKLNISLNKTDYNKRKKTVLQLNVKDDKGNAVNGNFSLAVTDANAVTNNNQQTILADLLLTSDIKGYVENANHYFDTINATTIKELDDLLLTQGWRRFVWQDVLNDKNPSTNYKKEKSLTVNGKVLSLKNEPVAGKHIMLIPRKGHGYILDTVTDNDGNFVFTDLNFNDDNPFLLQAIKTDKSKDVSIKLADFSAPSTDNNDKISPDMKQQFSNTLLPYLAQKQQQFDVQKKYGLLPNEHQLKDVIVTTPQQTKVQEAVAPSYNLNGPGNADQILTYQDFYDCHTVSTCLAGKLTGVYFKMVVNNPGERVPSWVMLPFSTSGMGAPMMVVLDGVYLTWQNHTLDMRNIDIYNVQSIEVLRSGGFLNVYGTNGVAGVLVITTKQGGIDYTAGKIQQKPLENVAFTTAKGYAAQREFYVPDYDNPVELNSPVPDKRTTIFWKPNITTDDNGNATIEWYNADNTGNCNIVIEGLSANGKLGHASFTYKMK